MHVFYGVGDLIRRSESGLYCEAGDFYIDPWRPVERAVITHAHGDHARYGMQQYLCAERGAAILQQRVGPDAKIQGVPYGSQLVLSDTTISFHPAGHVLGSAQIRVEHKGEVWVASGDYKLDEDTTCDPFEPVRCHTFITECTFGLPIYHWTPPAETGQEINAWWIENKAKGRTSLLMGYALGKAQRLISFLNPENGPIVLHGALTGLTRAYRESGIELPPTKTVSEMPTKTAWNEAIVLAPPSAQGTPWLRRFGEVTTAFASGWMSIRGMRRRRSIDKGFVLSDHADWKGLMKAIEATGAQRVIATHGYTVGFARALTERGYQAQTFETEFTGDLDEGGE